MELHKKRHDETYNEQYERWLKGELPDSSFVRPKCCFNHYFSLPNKGDILLPIFDYELFLVSIFQTLKRIDILKSRGLGITELVLRYILWRIVKSREWAYRMGAIITGLRLDPAVTLINRMKALFQRNFPIKFDTRQTEFIFNDVIVKAFPSRNSANTLRSYADFAFVFIDEADFFKLTDQIEIKHAAEGYFLKSQPLMIWVSTPHMPGGIMEKFRHQFLERVNTLSNIPANPYHIPLESNIKELENEYYFDYFHIELPYHVGLGKIYDEVLLAEERQKDYFPKEYLLQFGYGIGDLFTEADIRKCFIHEYNPFDYFKDTYKCLTIDQGLGSSKFAFMLTEFVPYPEQYGITTLPLRNQRFLVRTLFADEFYRPDPSEMENLDKTLIDEYHIIDQRNKGKIAVDGANIGMIKKIKEIIREPLDYDRRLETMPSHEKWSYITTMKCMPVNFAKLQKQMLYTYHDYVTKGYVAINKFQFQPLLDQMRIAKANDTQGLIKEKGGPTLDLLDCARMQAYVYSISM